MLSTERRARTTSVPTWPGRTEPDLRGYGFLANSFWASWRDARRDRTRPRRLAGGARVAYEPARGRRRGGGIPGSARRGTDGVRQDSSAGPPGLFYDPGRGGRLVGGGRPPPPSRRRRR